MSITFNSIPANLRTPGQYVEHTNVRALAGSPPRPNRVLICGQKRSTGTLAELTLKLVTRVSDADTWFGIGSQLAEMIRAFKAVNPYAETWALAIDDLAAGTAATGTIVVTGPATGDGTIALLIGGYRVTVAVADGDSASDVATAIGAAVNLVTAAPVTATVNTATVTLTCRHKGEGGNYIDVRHSFYAGEELPAGIALAITEVGGVVAGAGNPDATEIVAALGGDEAWQRIVFPWTDSANLTLIEDELLRRWGGTVMQEGMAITAAANSHANLITLGDSRNSQFLIIHGVGDAPTVPWVWAARCAAADAAISDPALPRQNVQVPGLIPPEPSDRFTREERDLLLNDGISTTLIGAGDKVYLERVITTYQENAAGTADTSYLNAETMYCLMAIRYDWRSRLSVRYPQHKLWKDDDNPPPAGQPFVSRKILRAEAIGQFKDWRDQGIVELYDGYEDDIIIDFPVDDPDRVDMVLAPKLVRQFRVGATQFQFQ